MSETSATNSNTAIKIVLKDQNGDYNKYWNYKVRLFAKLANDENDPGIWSNYGVSAWMLINSSANKPLTNLSFSGLKYNREYILTKILVFENDYNAENKINGIELKLSTNNPEERILFVKNHAINISKDSNDKIEVNKNTQDKIVKLTYNDIDRDLAIDDVVSASLRDKTTNRIKNVKGKVISDNKIQFEIPGLEYDKNYVFESFYIAKKPLMVKDFEFIGQPEIRIDNNQVIEPDYGVPIITRIKETFDPSMNPNDVPKIVVKMNAKGSAYYGKEFQLTYKYKKVVGDTQSQLRIEDARITSNGIYDKTTDTISFEFDKVITNNIYNKIFTFESLKPVGGNIAKYTNVESRIDKTNTSFNVRSEIQRMKTADQLNNKRNRTKFTMWYEKNSSIFEIYKFLKLNNIHNTNDESIATNDSAIADLFQVGALIYGIQSDGKNLLADMHYKQIAYEFDLKAKPENSTLYKEQGVNEFYKPIVINFDWRYLEGRRTVAAFLDKSTGKPVEKMKIAPYRESGYNQKWLGNDYPIKWKGSLDLESYKTSYWNDQKTDYGDVFFEHEYRYDFSNVNPYITFDSQTYDLVEIKRQNSRPEIAENNSMNIDVKLKLNNQENIESKQVILKYSYLNDQGQKQVLSSTSTNVAGTNKWSFSFNNLPYDKEFIFESIDFAKSSDTIFTNISPNEIDKFKTKAQDLKLVWNNNTNNVVETNSNGYIYLDLDAANIDNEIKRLWNTDAANQAKSQQKLFFVRLTDKNDSNTFFDREVRWDSNENKFKVDLFKDEIPYGQRTYKLEILNSPKWVVPGSFNMWDDWLIKLSREINVKMSAKEIVLDNGANSNITSSSLIKTFNFDNLSEYQLQDGDKVVFKFRNKSTNQEYTQEIGSVKGNSIILDIGGLNSGKYEIIEATKAKKANQWTDYKFTFAKSANRDFEILTNLFVEKVQSVRTTFWNKDDATTEIYFKDALTGGSDKKIRLIYNGNIYSEEVSLVDGQNKISVKHPNIIMPNIGNAKYEYTNIQIFENGNWKNISSINKSPSLKDVFYLTKNPLIDPESNDSVMTVTIGTEASKSFPSFISNLKLGGKKTFVPGHKYKLVISSWNDIMNKRSFEKQGIADNAVDIKKEYYEISGVIANSEGQLIINNIGLTPNQKWNILSVHDITNSNNVIDLKMKVENVFETRDYKSNSWYMRTWGAPISWYDLGAAQPAASSWSWYSTSINKFNQWVNLSIKGFNTRMWNNNGSIGYRRANGTSAFWQSVNNNESQEKTKLRIFDNRGNSVYRSGEISNTWSNDPSVIYGFENPRYHNLGKQAVLTSYDNVAKKLSSDFNLGIKSTSDVVAGKIWYNTVIPQLGNGITIRKFGEEPKDSIVKIENNQDKFFNSNFGRTRDWWDNMSYDREDANSSKSIPVGR